MRRFILSSLLVFLIAPNAYAEKPPKAPESRKEEIELLKTKLDKLEKLSDEEWQQKKDQNKARKELKKNRTKNGLDTKS